MLKGQFFRTIGHGARVSKSWQTRRERDMWQRRFWEQLITDQDDFNQHFDYIHWNPVKHNKAASVADCCIQVSTVMSIKVFMRRIGEMMSELKLKMSNNPNDALHVVQHILWL